ncbi:hypothetical protein TWF225_006221 [Orbilia oligospora]|nr:hypothetical protein TWF225_006221 [Orbilia oligospora]KAF3242318.1 hypothetical protein TWF128_010556 [Orbilia oligospora]KAF3246843.1 hypothetical protein TWF217_009860 [Orbilia oligospora]
MMIPIWRPCVIRQGVFAPVAPPSSFLALLKAARSPTHLLQLPFPSRTVSTIRQSILKPGHLRKQLLSSPYVLPTSSTRHLASLRRPSRRSIDPPSPIKASTPSTSQPSPPNAEGTAAPPPPVLGPIFADPKANAVSTETASELKVGSEAWYNYHRARARVSDREEPEEMSAIRRLAPSFVFLLVTLAGSAYYAFAYVHPRPKDRLFPNIPIAITTIGGIIAANFVVFLAWRIPPLWRILNTHFVQCPGDPRVLSLIGSVFSHHTLWHFAANMLTLFLIGTSLCEQVGRGNFLALYMSSGAIASFTSLTTNVIMKRFHVFGLGASGAVFGVLGGFAFINPDTELYFVLLPLFTVKAATIATAMGVWEFSALLFGWSMWMDHAAHLGGLLAGAGLAALLKEEARRRREAVIRGLLGKS